MMMMNLMGTHIKLIRINTTVSEEPSILGINFIAFQIIIFLILKLMETQKTGSTLVTFKFFISIGGGNHLTSGELSTRLPIEP